MIKEKFLKFLNWLQLNFRFLLEVIIRLRVGLRESKKLTNDDSVNEDNTRKEDPEDD